MIDKAEQLEREAEFCDDPVRLRQIADELELLLAPREVFVFCRGKANRIENDRRWRTEWTKKDPA
jgi:hypothetical protein